MKLSDIADINMGQSPNGASLNFHIGVEFHQGKLHFGDLFLDNSPIKTSNPTKLAKRGDVLLCVRAPVGVVNLTNRSVCIGRGLAALTPKNGMDSVFLLHFLRYYQSKIEQMASGSTFASISTAQLQNMPIVIPDLSTQLRIAGVLTRCSCHPLTVRKGFVIASR